MAVATLRVVAAQNGEGDCLMRVIAIVNQKGGCGKTTTATNLAGCLAADGARVLVVDLDPQAHATLALGIDPEKIDENLYEVLAGANSAERLQDVCIAHSAALHVAPSGIVLSALEQRLASEPVESRTDRLRDALAGLGDAYDFVLIDCPPNVGLLTFNALRAASEVIVPLETSFFAIHGVQKLLETIALLSERIGHNLTVRILPTLYDGRTRYARETLAQIREMFRDMCFDTVIRQNVKLREAASRGKPIVAVARSANGTADYAALAVEVEADVPSDAAEVPETLALAPSREVVVRFRDARASDVRIAGDFNGWVPDKGVRSSIQAEGQTRVWTKILQLPPGTYEYRYVVDGEWREDPNNPQAIPSSVGGRNSILVVR
ncbi:MAG: AAA family ATPase [Myxococcales bacterium]|nr:AAA family ATPase [Myxococcales bacterium]